MRSRWIPVVALLSASWPACQIDLQKDQYPGQIQEIVRQHLEGSGPLRKSVETIAQSQFQKQSAELTSAVEDLKRKTSDLGTDSSRLRTDTDNLKNSLVDAQDAVRKVNDLLVEVNLYKTQLAHKLAEIQSVHKRERDFLTERVKQFSADAQRAYDTANRILRDVQERTTGKVDMTLWPEAKRPSSIGPANTQEYASVSDRILTSLVTVKDGAKILNPAIVSEVTKNEDRKYMAVAPILSFIRDKAFVTEMGETADEAKIAADFLNQIVGRKLLIDFQAAKTSTWLGVVDFNVAEYLKVLREWNARGSSDANAWRAYCQALSTTE